MARRKGFLTTDIWIQTQTRGLSEARGSTQQIRKTVWRSPLGTQIHYPWDAAAPQLALPSGLEVWPSSLIRHLHTSTSTPKAFLLIGYRTTSRVEKLSVFLPASWSAFQEVTWRFISEARWVIGRWRINNFVFNIVILLLTVSFVRYIYWQYWTCILAFWPTVAVKLLLHYDKLQIIQSKIFMLYEAVWEIF